MNPKRTTPTSPTGPTITPALIYYILFRHKWLIAIISVAALVTAITVYFVWRPPYQSEAELMIKYIKDAKPLPEVVHDSNVTAPDSRGESIIASEIAILTSFDLAKQVAEEIGPTVILGVTSKSTNDDLLQPAAAVVRQGLDIPPSLVKSDVIRMTFTHPNAAIVSNTLATIIQVYEERHTAIHYPDNNQFVADQITELKNTQRELDKKIRDLRSGADIITVDGAKKANEDLMAETQLKINDSQAELAGDEEAIRQMTKITPPTVLTQSTNNTTQVTNQPIPPDAQADYQRLCTLLASQKSKAEELQGIYTTNYPEVQNELALIGNTEAQKEKLEKTFPGLIALAPAERTASGPAGPDPREALNQEIIKSDVLIARINFLTNQLAQIKAVGESIITNEGPLTQLEGEKKLVDSQLTEYQQRLDEARINNALGNSNIGIVESPTPPARNMAKLTKVVLGIFLGGVVFAFLLPFLIEFYLDRSLKHPEDIQIRLSLPFFISIPLHNGNGKPRLFKRAQKVSLLTAGTASGTETAAPPPDDIPAPASPTNGRHPAVWSEYHALHPFYETLRDRLMTYFEVINLTHKPKLVAVTSCAEGAGVTSTAVNLASSLSEIGEGNVLLVNMNARDGEVHHFYKGKLDCGLDEALEKETRQSACVQGNLYLAKELPEDDRLPRVLPKRFSHLLPKMKASDFDYIIFDMPPVSQISITPRLARFMDMVLLVIESGKTDRDVATRAAAVLSETKTNVGVVLNKNRSYVPRRLHQDF